MSKIDPRSLSIKLQKGELSRLYYLFGEDVTGVEKMTSKIIKTAVNGNEKFALTKISGKKLDLLELNDIIGQFHMISDYNCILINDYNCEKTYNDMRERRSDGFTQKLISILKAIPEKTIVIFNVTGFEVKVKRDVRNNSNNIKDKNRKLTDFVEKNGIICEFQMKKSEELSKIIVSKMSARGVDIKLCVAKKLAEMCLCNNLVIDNELEKLYAYANGRDITMVMLKKIVHIRDNINIYNLANAVVTCDSKFAFEALCELNFENFGLFLYKITNAFLDLYRITIAKQYSISLEQVAFDYGKRFFYIKNFFLIDFKNSIKHLRKCLSILSDTNTMLNSMKIDPRTAIEAAIMHMLSLDEKYGGKQ